MTKLELPNCFSNIVVIDHANDEMLKLSQAFSLCLQLSTRWKFLQPSSLNQYAATDSSLSTWLVHALSSILKNREIQVGM